MVFSRSRLRKAMTLLLVTLLLCSTTLAANRRPQRRGKVIIIRGAFTVFSLGMNELGKKLAEQGLDVEVIADISAGRAAAKLRSEYQHNRNLGPIIFIGHSRGAELGPKQARYLKKYKIPVKLVVMVDAVHKTAIPSNVERCVNLYQRGSLGLPHGTPASADSKRTKMINTDIDRLRSRNKGGSINHFNIDSSAWIHSLVVAEVLKACPVVGENRAPALVAKPKTATTRQSTPARRRLAAPAVAQRKTKSGLRYPGSVIGGYWAESATRRSTTSINSKPTTGQKTIPWGNGRYRPRSTTSKKSQTTRPKTAQRPSTTRSKRSRSKTATRSRTTTRSAPRTATRPTKRTPQRTRSTRARSTRAQKPNARSAKKTTAAPRTAMRSQTRTQPKTKSSKTVPSKTVPSKTVPSKTVPAKTVPAKTVAPKTVAPRSSNRPKSNVTDAKTSTIPAPNGRVSKKKKSAPVQVKLRG